MNVFDKPLFVLEMANNHQGDVEHGKKIIREMKDVVVNYKEFFNFAVKFQYRQLDTFIHPDFINREDIKNVKRFKDTRISMEEYKELKQEAVNLGFITICTPFDEESVDNITGHGYDVIKIASCSFSDWTLLEKIAEKKIPVIASAAGSTMESIDNVINFFRHREIDISLMHCIAQYPTPIEDLEMNQITLYKECYPMVKIGFSTHESPDNLEPVQVAIAKGASIFERHVGINTDTITLNGYSSTPIQIKAWLDAALRAYKMCGVSDKRYVPKKAETDDLNALKRGVFACDKMSEGDVINSSNSFLAFPCQKGQLLAHHISKYRSIILQKPISVRNQSIMLEDVIIKDNTERVQEVVAKVLRILKKSNIVIPINGICEISHHYGIEKFEKSGVAMIDCINREYCKKILIVIPGQSHPTHYHKQKEEMFLIIFGSLTIVCNGEEHTAQQGETVLVERGVNHCFSSESGCVFEEISTTHFENDSFYENADGFIFPRKTKVYITKGMLDNLYLE